MKMTGKELIEKLYQWKEMGLTLDQVKVLYLTELSKSN